ncbi:unnamed protein product [Clonostachys chloroleuca]|uniref:Uncharacterized protein n=1 Tax=Clonostachys chloroleuca TaxID=1926264 RepID=A0AA35LS45_9HYPO|nr:unnamed protein product [Clonostachys chloroleuca]
MGAEHSRLIGEKLIEFSQDSNSSGRSRECLSELINDTGHLLPADVWEDIKALVIVTLPTATRRKHKDYHDDPNTTLVSKNHAPISKPQAPVWQMKLPKEISSKLKAWEGSPETFFDIPKTSYTGLLCDYINVAEEETKLCHFRIRFALREFSLNFSSWGREPRKFINQLKAIGDKPPPKTTFYRWRREGVVYANFAKQFGLGALFVFPFTRRQAQSQGFEPNISELPLAIKTIVSECEGAGKEISEHLSTKQRAGGLYNEAIRCSQGTNGNDPALQPVNVDLSVVPLNSEASRSSISPTTNCSDQVRSFDDLWCSGENQCGPTARKRPPSPLARESKRTHSAEVGTLPGDRNLFNEDLVAPAGSPAQQVDVAHISYSSARTRNFPEEESGSVNVPDGSSLPIRYLAGQAPVNVDPARITESEEVDVGIYLQGRDDSQDLDTTSLGLLSYAAANLAQESPGGASLSSTEMVGPISRSDIPHGQIDDVEQRQTMMYDFPAAELGGIQLDTHHIDEFSFPDFLDDLD